MTFEIKDQNCLGMGVAQEPDPSPGGQVTTPHHRHHPSAFWIRHCIDTSTVHCMTLCGVWTCNQRRIALRIMNCMSGETTKISNKMKFKTTHLIIGSVSKITVY